MSLSCDCFREVTCKSKYQHLNLGGLTFHCSHGNWNRVEKSVHKQEQNCGGCVLSVCVVCTRGLPYGHGNADETRFSGANGVRRGAIHSGP